MHNKFLNRYRIQSTRKPNWDYSSSGWYFVTICTQDRICWFGDVVDSKMKLNTCGQMINKWWNKMPDKFLNIKLDEFVIMPNHIHGIITINSVETGPRARLNSNNSVETGPRARLNSNRDAHTGASLHLNLLLIRR